MAKVVMFPQKRKLPKGVEDHLYDIAKDYVKTITGAVELMGLEPSDSNYEEFMKLVEEVFAKGVMAAIEEME